MSAYNKKAGITLYVIIALFIVAVVMLYLFLISPDTGQPEPDNPKKAMELCIRYNTQKAISIMLPQGGYIFPTNYKLYENNKIAYLCYTKNYYQKCINQEPVYIKHLEDEIVSYIKPKLQECFFSMKKEFESKNYLIEEKDSGLEILARLEPQAVNINLQSSLKLSKNSVSYDFENFSYKYPSPIYNLGMVAQEIISQEITSCSFEYIAYMILHGEFNIERTTVGIGENAAKIYAIESKPYADKLRIAVRNCVVPPGL